MDSPAGSFLGKSFLKAVARTFVPLIVFSEKRSELGVCWENLQKSSSSNSAYALTVMSWTALTRLRVRPHGIGLYPQRCTSSSQSGPELVETDDCAIPLKPTWSVDDLLSSYPRPTISSSALHRLHVLSALTPPEEGTSAHSRLTRELEDLVRLVESVRSFNASGASSTVDTTLDSRVWAEGTGIDLQKVPPGDRDLAALDPIELLSRASRIESGFYVVHSDRSRK